MGYLELRSDLACFSCIQLAIGHFVFLYFIPKKKGEIYGIPWTSQLWSWVGFTLRLTKTLDGNIQITYFNNNGQSILFSHVYQQTTGVDTTKNWHVSRISTGDQLGCLAWICFVIIKPLVTLMRICILTGCKYHDYVNYLFTCILIK